MEADFAAGKHDEMWDTAMSAPHSIASLYDQRILVMIDEFQNLSGYIYRDQDCKNALDPSIPGSYHELVESKVAPMLTTGSAVGWLVNVIDTYLQMGRLQKIWVSPYLTPEEGLEAVYRYAENYRTEITNESALLINQATHADPYFIPCMFHSIYPERDLSTEAGVLACARYEITDRNADMASEWFLYLDSVLPRINAVVAKKLLLFLTRNSDRDYSTAELKTALNLELEADEINKRLEVLAKADLIRGRDIKSRWQGYKDGTLYLVLQERFEDELEALDAPREDLDYRVAELKRSERSLQGALNQVSGELI
ncbi:MAG: hypothetical protein MI867_25395, partial [Pseudomonadales bacterium]|nr:hypothetical protein [Pseudomonadales bacterium]